jgi:aminoglycoside phosphotransferase family enzyme
MTGADSAAAGPLSPDSSTVTSAPGTGRPPYFAARETHSAIVLFMADLAYKIKKPIDLGFLDFRTEPARLAVCHREVELNRRLAPDVYLAVADVDDSADHLIPHAVGAVHDALFGSLVMVGLGGVQTDALGDRSFRSLPH